jgi:hypothetical protein
MSKIKVSAAGFQNSFSEHRTEKKSFFVRNQFFGGDNPQIANEFSSTFLA